MRWTIQETIEYLRFSQSEYERMAGRAPDFQTARVLSASAEAFGHAAYILENYTEVKR